MPEEASITGVSAQMDDDVVEKIEAAPNLGKDEGAKSSGWAEPRKKVQYPNILLTWIV